MENQLNQIVDALIYAELDFFDSRSELDNEIALTRIRRLSKEYSKFGGVRE